MNGQGAGLTYVEDDKLIVDKGYFKFEELYEQIEYHEEKEMIVHFRIASAGSVKLENCHPFHVQSDAHKQFSFAASHNGTLSWRSTKEESDTFCFVEDILGPCLDRDPWFLDFLPGFAFLTRFCGDRNKMAIMRWDAKTKTSKIYIINKSAGIEDMGCWFSNGTYKIPFVYHGRGAGAWHAYGDYLDEEERFFGKAGFLSDKDWSRHGFHQNEEGRWVSNRLLLVVKQTKGLLPGQSVIPPETNSNVALAQSASSGNKQIEVPRDEDAKKIQEEIRARESRNTRFNARLEHLTKKGRKIIRRLANDWAKSNLPSEVFHRLSLAEHVQDFRDNVRYCKINEDRLLWTDQKLDLWIVDEYILANKNPEFLKELALEDGTPDDPDETQEGVQSDAALGGQVHQFPEHSQGYDS